MPRLTIEQLADFDRDGYVVLGSILRARQLDALLAAELTHRPDIPFTAGGAPSKLVLGEQLCHYSTAVRQFCLAGTHIPALAQLLGPNVAFTHTQFIAKFPEDDPVVIDPDGVTVPTDQPGESWIPLHQDDGYGRLDPPLDITIWTALTDTNEANGCLVIVPGSHRNGVVPHEKVESNAALREARADGAIPVPLAAGEAVAFSGLTLHGSGPNRSSEVRIGMHARYCHPGVRMVINGNKAVLDDAHSWMVLGDAPNDGWTSANEAFLKG